MKRLYPDYYFHSVFELSAEFFLAQGITHVIFDIDDTLVRHGIPHATEEIDAFLSTLQQGGLTLALISNSKHPRAEVFNRSLSAPLFAIGHAFKPRKGALNAFFEYFKVEPNKVALIGDQLLTDILLCKKWNILSVLVQPIARFETPFFYLKRAVEAPVLKSYFKHLEDTNKPKED